jgi:predicted dinucleotide-binding enzyme
MGSQRVEIAVAGTGFIGGIPGRSLAQSGHSVRFGSRHREDDEVAMDSEASVVSVADALRNAEVILLALRGAGWPD